MADRNMQVSDSMELFRTTYNLTATDVGDIAVLATTAVDLVDAVNELHGEVNTNTTAIGTLTSLNAAILETDLVTAINNFHGDFTTFTGEGTVLDTTAANLAAAVNEIHGEFNTLDAFVSQGVIDTTATTIRTAVNELHGEINTNTTAIGTLTSLNAAILETDLVTAINNFHGDFTTFTGEGTALDTTATDLAGALNEIHGAVATTEVQKDAETLAALHARTGLLSALDAGIIGANDDNLVAAINHILGLTQVQETNFANPVTFSADVDFATNVDIIGALTFDGAGPAITAILDQDNMSGDSATALATQQSIKAHVATVAASIDAITLGGLASSAFLRSNADDILDSNFHLQIGTGSGSIQIEHSSVGNITTFTPNTGIALDTTKRFSFDGDEDFWKFGDKLQVGGVLDVLGAFTSLGIDDNATANKITVANTLITLKTATQVQGNLTLTSGVIAVPSDSTVGNGAGEYIDIDGTNNETSVVAGNVEGLRATATAVDLRYAGVVKLATTTGGVAITGAATLTGNLTSTSTTFQLNGSEANDKIIFDAVSDSIALYGNDLLSVRASATDAKLYYAGSEKLATTTGGVSVTGTVTSTGNMIIPATGNISNGANEKVLFGAGTVAVQVDSISILDVTATAVNLNKNTNVTGNLDVTGNITGTFVIPTLADLTVDSLTVVDAISSISLAATGEMDNGGDEKLAFTATTTSLWAGGVKRLEVGAATDITGDLTVSGTINGTISQVAFGNITTGTITASGRVTAAGVTLSSGDLILPATGRITNGGDERIEFETTTIDFYTGNGLDFRVGSTTSNFFGILNVSGVLQAAGGLTVTGTTTLPSNGTITNGSGENIVFSTTTVVTQIANAEILRCDAAGIDVTGAIIATGDISAFSDANLKENIAPIDDPLVRLSHLNGVTYNWNDLAKKRSPNLRNARKAGVIAQDARQALSEVVHAVDEIDSQEILGVDYNGIVALLVEANKALLERVEALEKGQV